MRDKTSVPRRPARALLSLLGRPLCALALAVTVVTVVATGPVAADGGLLGLGGVLGTVTGTVTGVVAAVVPGWDDGYTTSPTEMSAVTEAIGANQLWDRGVTGSGVGVALIDAVVVPVHGLGGAGKVLTGPALSFESHAPAAAYLDTYGSTTVAPFSSRGSASRSVDVVAPGVSLLSLRNPGSFIDQNHPGAVVDNRFFRGTGTSQAAAVVSGAAALLLSAHPGLTPDQVKTTLKATARPLALLDGKAEGSGMINVNAAAQAALPLGAPQSWAPATGRGSIEQAR